MLHSLALAIKQKSNKTKKKTDEKNICALAHFFLQLDRALDEVAGRKTDYVQMSARTHKKAEQHLRG